MAQTIQAVHLYGDQDFIDHTPEAALLAGEVVGLDASGTSKLIGVTTRAIAAGEKGALAVSGVYKFKKAVDTSQAFVVGEKIGWDEGTNNAVGTGLGTTEMTIGVCVAAAATTDDFVVGRLNHVKPS